MDVVFSRPDPLDPDLARRWSALAARVAPLPFLDWPWIGALLRQPGMTPWLAEAREDGRTAGLALLQPGGGWGGRGLLLNQQGGPADGAFMEHNGPLALAAERAGVLAALLGAAGRRTRRVRLAGIDSALLAAARAAGTVGPVQTRPAPFLDLAPGRPVLDRLSRNSRAQLRRAWRACAALGPVRAEPARDAAEALDWFEALLALHAAWWGGRGVPSGFATPAVLAFARALVGLGAPDRVELLRVRAGPRTLGYLLNLRAGRLVCAYQAGIDPAAGEVTAHPGLVCHLAAIEDATRRGAARYDFLAGEARYKRSLSDGAQDLHWLDWHPRWSSGAALARVRRALDRGR